MIVSQVRIFHYIGSLQGSTLGHLLFTIYISPLKYIIEQTLHVKYHIYSEDIQVYTEYFHHDQLILCVNNICR